MGDKSAFAWVIPALVSLLLLGGCIGAQRPPASSQGSFTESVYASGLCVKACVEAANLGVELNSGPCLGVVQSDWVCDVAHNPRVAADDLQQNQCSDFREGKAKHFVEVDSSCKVIRAN